MATGMPKQRKRPHVLATNNPAKSQAQLLDETAVFPSPSSSGDSSWSRSPAHANSAIVGYVKIDDKVRISLGSVSSASEFRKLKRRLVNELERVRKLRRKIDGSSGEQCGDWEGRNYGNGEKITSGGGGKQACKSVARVNSEVSCVGPTSGRANQMINHSDADEEHKNAMEVPSQKEIEPVRGKKPNPGHSSNGTKFSSAMVKKCGELLAKLMRHQYGWVFNAPVDAKKLKLHDYYTIIKNPMDLGTVKTRLSKNWYKSAKEFAEDVRLTFNNAMTYNEKGQDVHYMADLLLKLFESLWRELLQELKDSPLTKAHKGSRLLAPSVSGSMGKQRISKQEGIKSIEDKRLMTFEEKQKLSTDLQFLPSDQLESVVEIIRKRNPGLFQLENEIEVDIDCFDSETLWELDRFVNTYMESVKVKGEDEVKQESYLTSGNGNLSNKPGKGKSYGKIEAASQNHSNSSSGVSGSPSKDSDNDSSSGG